MTWIYIRVSTKEQALKGFSIEAQTEKCLRYARAHGLLLGDETNCGIAGVFVDGGQSATKKVALTDRPGGRALIQAMRPGDHLICTSPHRLFRSLLQSENQIKIWEESKVCLHFVDNAIRTDTPNGRLMLQMMFSVAEWRRRVLSARVKEGKNLWRGTVEPKVLKESREDLDMKRISPDDPLTHMIVQTIYNRLNPPQQEFSGTIRAYIRVSKAEQNIDGQKQAVLTWIENSYLGDNKPKVVWYVDQGQSAFSKVLSKRTQGKELWREVKKGDIVLALRADRIVRSIKDISHLIDHLDKRGATLVMVDCGLRTDSAFGRLMVSLLSFVAEMESHETDVSSNSGVAESYRTRGASDEKIPDVLHPTDFRPAARTRVPQHKDSFDTRPFVDPEVYAQGVVLHYCLYRQYGRVMTLAVNKFITQAMGWPDVWVNPKCRVMDGPYTVPVEQRQNETCPEYAARLIEMGKENEPLTKALLEDRYKTRWYNGPLGHVRHAKRRVRTRSNKFFDLMPLIDLDNEKVPPHLKLLKKWFISYEKGEFFLPPELYKEFHHIDC